ncbi:hypothetical protein B0O99DRAFT_585764 [Bisporella sp. PMI_857]|nr:hypothetical protein B0O99DRAFT_585764 [Bisporella sp. PMI_857]
MYFLLPSFLLVIAALVPQVKSHPAQSHWTGRAAGAVYLITNSQSNSVVSLAIKQNGMLSDGSSTSTGSAGSNSIDESTNQAAAPDSLVSQSSLTVVGNFIFAVNAGSNTVSMLKINKNNPTKLTMVGQPVSIPGEFPNTVAASLKKNVVCVGCSRAKAGVSCASFSSQGMREMDALRPFDLNQTTPPVGPLNTVSQVFFSDDQSKLFTTVKGDPSKTNTGFLATFPVQEACGATKASVNQDGIQSSPNSTAVLFGSSIIPGSTDIFVTEASFGGVVLSIDTKSNIAMVKGKAAIEGQRATCWVAVALNTNTAFVTDVATNRLVEMSLEDASIQNVIDLSPNGDPGLIDLKAAGNFIYALSPGNGTTPSAVTVLNAASKTQVQHFQVNGTFDRNAMGMAVFMSKMM